jgi:hypothetical protein
MQGQSLDLCRLKTESKATVENSSSRDPMALGRKAGPTFLKATLNAACFTCPISAGA